LRHRATRHVGFVAIAITTSTYFAVGQEVENILINDPRPVAAAVEQIQQRCQCVITYDDPKWGPADVENAAGRIHHRPGAPLPLIPKGRPFSFTVARPVSGNAAVTAALQVVLRAAAEAGNADAFQARVDNGVFQVAPKKGSVFDVRITLPAADRTLNDTVTSVLDLVGQQTGERLVVAIAPVNLMMRQRVSLHADGERAADVLIRALSAGGRKISWRLLYDAGTATYYLNLHTVGATKP
jgi:hypothetical protein